MKDKYYTPKIEEFHVGFEFEIANHDTEYTKENFISLGKWGFDDVEDLIKLSRVKYLDREDIESLGFNCKGMEFSFITKNIKSRYGKLDPIVEIELELNATTHEVVILYQPEYLFKGVIKNKSELKKLLKQLNIL